MSIRNTIMTYPQVNKTEWCNLKQTPNRETVHETAARTARGGSRYAFAHSLGRARNISANFFTVEAARRSGSRRLARVYLRHDFCDVSDQAVRSRR
jgi:hypothetical protein